MQKPISSRYYLPESMPWALCGACLIVVLQSSEKAKAIYGEIVQSYGLPGVQAVFDATQAELPRRERRAMFKRNQHALRMRRSQGMAKAKPVYPDSTFFKGLNDEVAGMADCLGTRFESEVKKGDDPDLKRWWELVNELIKMGFNRKSEQGEGVYRVEAAPIAGF